MNAIFMDTLKFSKRLRDVGMDEGVANELANAIQENGEAIKEDHDQSLSGLATKQDIGILKQDIIELESRIDLKLELNKKDIIFKLGSLIVAGVGLIAVLIKF